MASQTGWTTEIPTWSGDPVDFDSFAIACRLYQTSLKDSERKLAASRVWVKLGGPAKAVVRNLSPEEYEHADGLTRLVQVLRNNPLQQLPVPNLFKRLDVWHHLRRQPGESIPQLLVREEDMFVQLQSALTRAREDRASASASNPLHSRMTPSTPSQSPITAQVPPTMSGAASPATGIPVTAQPREARRDASTPQVPVDDGSGFTVKDFFEDKLRGYRLLKASGLAAQERQNVLTQTGNSTSFMQIRRTLRTLYAEESSDKTSQQHGWRRNPRVWWNDAEECWDGAEDDMAWEAYDPGYQQPWPNWYVGDESWDYDSWQYDDDQWEAWDDEITPLDNPTDPDEQQLQEAFALATEANKTLAQARDAVRRTRQARGYFAPESMSGKGKSPSSSPTKGSFPGKGQFQKGSKSNPKGKAPGPCLQCGRTGHWAAQCPDRFADNRGKSFSKGYAKGKFGKSKSKGFVQFHDLCWQLPADILVANVDRGNRVIIDSGASENAVGIGSLENLITGYGIEYQVETNDRPIFRFGNGHQLQALSRADLLNTSLGTLSFYVLDDDAYDTPPLMGGKTLRQLGAMLAYQNDLFIYQRQDPQLSSDQWVAVKMHSHPSHHVSIDVMEPAVVMEDSTVLFNKIDKVNVSDAAKVSEVKGNSIFMMHGTSSSSVHGISPPDSLSSSISSLAQRLASLRTQLDYVSGTMCGGRPPDERVPLWWKPQTEAQGESTWNAEYLPDMRSAPDVPAEEGIRWSEPTRGPSSQLNQSSHGGDQQNNSGQSGDGASGQWEAHGIERTSTATWTDGDHGCKPLVPHLPEANGSAESRGWITECEGQGITYAKDVSCNDSGRCSSTSHSGIPGLQGDRPLGCGGICGDGQADHPSEVAKETSKFKPVKKEKQDLPPMRVSTAQASDMAIQLVDSSDDEAVIVMEQKQAQEER
eukprot:s59_g32.t1